MTPNEKASDIFYRTKYTLKRIKTDDYKMLNNAVSTMAQLQVDGFVELCKMCHNSKTWSERSNTEKELTFSYWSEVNKELQKLKKL